MNAIGEECEVWLFKISDDLSALLVVNNSIDVDDLSRDADLFEVLRLGWFQILGKRLLAGIPGFRYFAGSFVLFFVGCGWLASGLRPSRVNTCAEQQLRERNSKKPIRTCKSHNYSTPDDISEEAQYPAQGSLHSSDSGSGVSGGLMRGR